MDSNTICMHFLPLAMTWLMAYGDNNGNGIKQSGAMKQLKRQLILVSKTVSMQRLHILELYSLQKIKAEKKIEMINDSSKKYE